MSSLLIVKPIPAVAVANPNANGDPSNGLTPDPKEVVLAVGTVGEVLVRLDLGADTQVDSFFCGFWNSYLTTVHISTGTSAAGSANVLQATLNQAPSDYTTPRRRHCFTRLGAPVAARYVQFGLVRDGSGNAASAGVFATGLALQPFYGREWGSGRLPRDMSDVTQLRGGGYGIDRGARVPGFQFTLGDLTDAELAKAWDIVDDVGASSPVLVCEDPDVTTGLNERLHWGLFDRPEAYERDTPGRNRWSFRLLGWN